MEFDLSSPEARAQAEATRAFGNAFVGTPPPQALRGLPQVLVTGFGRFLHHTENATGRLVSELVPQAPYPATVRGDLASVDEPAPQFSSGWTDVLLPTVGRVALCGMILPAQWGLGPVLLRKQLATMDATFVLMNGIAGPAQPLWLELGAANHASAKQDGSGVVRPVEESPGAGQTLVPGGAARTSCLASFAALRTEARRLIAESPSAVDVLPGAEFQTFARAENSYLCNELTYAACDILHAKAISRIFLHWPSALYPSHLNLGARIVLRLMEVELQCGSEERLLGEQVRSI